MSHLAVGLQRLTLQDCSDQGGQETRATATDSAQLTTSGWEKAYQHPLLRSAHTPAEAILAPKGTVTSPSL